MNAYDAIITKQAELTALAATLAAEDRKPTDEEKARLTALKSEVEEIRKSWESDGRRRFLEGITKPASEPSPVILKSGESFATHIKGTYSDEFERLSMSRLMKGYIVGDWSGAELEQKAMASSPTSAGGILIPAPLAARIIDIARNRAVALQAGVSTVPMSTSTLKLARVTGGLTASWYSEAAAITPSDATLDSVTFTARKLAALVVVNNELLEDAQNADTVIQNAIGQALALELDRVILRGSGTPPEPRGIYGASGVSTVASVGTPADFDKFLTAVYTLSKDNYSASGIIMAPRTAESLAKLKSGITNDKTPLAIPPDYARLPKFVTNQIPTNLGGGTNESFAIVGQFDQCALGLRQTLQIEVSREGSYDDGSAVRSAFQKDQTLIRAILRADVQLLQPKAFCNMLAITA